MKKAQKALFDIIKLIKNNQLILFSLLFLICFSYFSWLQSSPTFLDPDSFYHARIAKLISEQGIIYNFPWLQNTILLDNFTDHHLLYHLYLVPFVMFLPPAIGAKLAQVFLASLAFLTFYWLLKKLEVKYALFFVFVLLISESFVFRINLVKAQPLAMILLFISLYLIFKRKYLLLILLGFVYVWSYGGWFMLLALAGTSVVTEAFFSVVEQIEIKKFKIWPSIRTYLNFKVIKKLLNCIFTKENWFLLGSICLGLILGLVINPYFPKNLIFYWIQVVQIGLINLQTKIGVGAEWYGYSLLDLLKYTFLPFTLVILSLVLFIHYFKKYDLKVKYIFIMTVLFFLSCLKAQRNIEYVVPFMVIFSALVFSQSYSNLSIKNEIKKGFKNLGNYLGSYFIFKFCCIFVASALIISIAIGSVLKEKSYFNSGFNLIYLKKASGYIQQNSAPGDIVFHSDWDESLILFYHNYHNYYLVGLDPTFMYAYNKDLHQKWVDITLGSSKLDVYDVIKNDFKAKFVLITQDHESMVSLIKANQNFEQVFEDGDAIIFKVLNNDSQN